MEITSLSNYSHVPVAQKHLQIFVRLIPLIKEWCFPEIVINVGIRQTHLFFNRIWVI